MALICLSYNCLTLLSVPDIKKKKIFLPTLPCLPDTECQNSYDKRFSNRKGMPSTVTTTPVAGFFSL